MRLADEWENGTVQLMALDRNSLLDPIVLAAIGHLSAAVDVSIPMGLIDGLEKVITRSG